MSRSKRFHLEFQDYLAWQDRTLETSKGSDRAPQDAETRHHLRVAYDDALAVVGQIEADAGPTLRDELGRSKRVQAAFMVGQDRERFRRLRLGQRSGLWKLMRAELGSDPTVTNRARLYLDHMLMVSANVTAVTGSSWPSTRAWLRSRLPTMVEMIGPEIEADFSHHLAEASAELAKRIPIGDAFMMTGPTPAEIAATFDITTAQLRQAKANTCGLTSIDPVDRQTRDRERKERERRAAGMKPQGERTSKAEMVALASRLGCSVATLYRKRADGTLDAFVATRETDLSPNIIDIDGGHFGLIPANDDLPNLNRHYREHGYRGRNLVMSSWDVEFSIRQNPDIATDLPGYFARMEAMLEDLDFDNLPPGLAGHEREAA